MFYSVILFCGCISYGSVFTTKSFYFSLFLALPLCFVLYTHFSYNLLKKKYVYYHNCKRLHKEYRAKIATTKQSEEEYITQNNQVEDGANERERVSEKKERIL